MNKELIKKYKAEFDHWLNGGTLLTGLRNLVSNQIKWYASITNPFIEDSTSSETLIVINDEYIEFRKALAEDKIVEVLHYTGYKELDKNPWRLFAIGLSSFNKPVDNYRIKPEEPQFKEGDWVRDISSKEVIKAYKNIISKNFELWKPQPGEWCWFWNNDKQPFLAQLECLDDDGYITVQGLHGSLADLSDACFSFEYCEPFIGELPTQLQQPE